jgi:L-asparaginase / beta-aspartyl-peptidase
MKKTFPCQKRFISILTVLAFLLIGVSCQQPPETRPDYVLVIHGGAGVIEASRMSAEQDSSYRDALTKALEAGTMVLETGGTAVDAVIAAIIVMEDSPLFNAGKGAVYNEAGIIEHDASIMDGSDLSAGAVGALRNIKNPILAAHHVMLDGRHVFMVGEGARHCAVKAGLETVDPQYFFDQNRWDSYERTRKTTLEKEFPVQSKHGTVGAVALDKAGNLAAATSTGGMHFKRKGRLGDSPVIGAGTYADNSSCAVSATGHGEFFIRNAVAYDIAARMTYAGQSLQEASDEVVMQKLAALDVGGGIIAVDQQGNIAMPFNTSGMFRGYMFAGQKPVVKLFAGE